MKLIKNKIEKMKKITIFYILILSLLPNITFWLESSEKCLISDWTSPVITNYIKNIRTVLGNINSQLIQSTPDKSIKVNYTKAKTLVSRWFFGITNWDYYWSYFNFYVTYTISNEYVAPIWRDYNILENETKWLDKYYNYLINKWFLEITLNKEDICKNVENCNYDWNVIDILTKIKWELEYFKNYYRWSILNSGIVLDKTKLQLIPESFEQDFEKYYNSDSTLNCSRDWWFFERISKKAQEIINWQEMSKDWIKSMKEAIALARWEWYWDKTYADIEKELLQKELARQWVNPNQAEVMIQNLEKYNTSWFSKDNNFITNSFNYIYSNIKNQLNDFNKTVLETFDDEKKSIWVENFMEIKKWNEVENEIAKNIAELYHTQIPNTSSQEELIDNVIWRLVKMHNNINNSIEVLDKTIKISQKVCNSQAFGKWKCEY